MTEFSANQAGMEHAKDVTAAKMTAAFTIRQLTFGRVLTGVAITITLFVVLGTVSALWQNPFFIRMTPADGWEIGLLALLSLLSGLYVVIRRPFCSNKSVGVGGVLGFLGVACPVCNKILLFAFGSELLLTYFEPVRIYVAAIGVILTGWAVAYEWRRRQAMPINESCAKHSVSLLPSKTVKDSSHD